MQHGGQCLYPWTPKLRSYGGAGNVCGGGIIESRQQRKQKNTPFHFFLYKMLRFKKHDKKGMALKRMWLAVELTSLSQNKWIRPSNNAQQQHPLPPIPKMITRDPAKAPGIVQDHPVDTAHQIAIDAATIDHDLQNGDATVMILTITKNDQGRAAAVAINDDGPLDRPGAMDPVVLLHHPSRKRNQ